jgi:hypothetical protein
MAAELCPKCKRSHPGRSCDYDDKGDGVETADLSEAAKEANQKEKDKSEPE